MAEDYVGRGVPGFQEMMVPVLRALEDLGGAAETAELNRRAVKIMGLSKEVCAIPHKDTSRTEVSNRMAWARSYLKKYGLIDNPNRGVWQFTDRYSGDPDSVDPAAVVRFVRDAAQQTMNSAGLSPVSAAGVRAQLLLDALKRCAQAQARTIRLNDRAEMDGELFLADAVLPEGLDGMPGPLVCQIADASELEYFWESAALRNFRWNGRRCGLLLVSASPEADARLDALRGKVAGLPVRFMHAGELERLAEDLPAAEVQPFIVDPKRAMLQLDVAGGGDEQWLAAQQQERLAQLAEVYRRQQLTLVLGAGVSMDAGVPGWNTLVQRLNLRMLGPPVPRARLYRRRGAEAAQLHEGRGGRLAAAADALHPLGHA